ncbi:MAG: hypothetical protein JWO15_3569 [Sphingomonadales bacterium]|nr:hypothetical protein [Sphingomonadales bacterium]
MKTYIAYCIALVFAFACSIFLLRSGVLSQIERGLFITLNFAVVALFVVCVTRALKIREEKNWLAKFEEA